MNDKSQYKYSLYLNKRSFFGFVYRKFFLYPKLSNLYTGNVLDVGCGIGDFLRFCKNSVGVDVNPYNVSICNSHGLNASFMQENVLSFPNEFFDSVMLDNVIEHLKDPSDILYEIKRVLKPNGFLVIGIPGHKGYSTDLDHKVYYNEPDLEALALKAGFAVNKYLYTPFFRSNFLSRILTQYCIYTQWQKVD